MDLRKRNQLFIDSIQHWIEDGMDKFEDGLSLYTEDGWYEYWTDGSAFNLNGHYCPMCEYASDICPLCLLNKDGDMCVKEYDSFLNEPTIETCQAVIDRVYEEWKGNKINGLEEM